MLVTQTDVVDRPEQKCDSDMENISKKQRKRRNRRNRAQKQRAELEEPLQQADDSDEHSGGGSRARPLNVAGDTSTTAK